MTEHRHVLAIGLAGYKGMSAAQMAQASKSMTAECAKHGIAFDSRFIQSSFPAEERKSLLKHLKGTPWSVVSVGSGLRLDAQHTRLLEDVVEMCLTAVQPAPKLAFPTLPQEMIPTFKRLFETETITHGEEAEAVRPETCFQ